MGRISNYYKNAFEGNCIKLLANAYTLAITIKSFQINWNENDFSEMLCDLVNEAEFSLNEKITCKTEKKLSNSSTSRLKGYSDKLPRIDFEYSKIWNRQRFHCYMEAKRLGENNSALKRAYINEGIERFVSGKYPKGIMVGYNIQGDIFETIKGINELMLKDDKEAESLYPKSHKLVKHYYESNHSLVDVIKHLIFDFV